MFKNTDSLMVVREEAQNWSFSKRNHQRYLLKIYSNSTGIGAEIDGRFRCKAGKRPNCSSLMGGKVLLVSLVFTSIYCVQSDAFVEIQQSHELSLA
jgi:hypothetical protein